MVYLVRNNPTVFTHKQWQISGTDYHKKQTCAGHCTLKDHIYHSRTKYDGKGNVFSLFVCSQGYPPDPVSGPSYIVLSGGGGWVGR